MTENQPTQDLFRPQYHYTPKQNWVNDPNGLVYFEGEYHLFYQHNPLGNLWGNISWGHAVSPDLLHWEELPLAIPFTDGVMAFSGCALVDWNNTSGFGVDGKPLLVALFTGHYSLENPPGHRQDQRLAYSNDRGRTWMLYEDNPVLDREMKDFRDPKVFWHAPSQKWIMVLVVSDQYKVHFYASSDLKNWEYLSEFGPLGSAEGVWEVPELLELPIVGTSKTHWMLKVDVGQGGPWGGSAAQYFTGRFDGIRFIPDADQGPWPRWVDMGQDFYAAIAWSDLPKMQNRTVWQGWMSNWAYAARTPTHPWRGTFNIPREVSLLEEGSRFTLIQKPIPELETLREEPYSLPPQSISGEQTLQTEGRALEIVATFELGSAAVFGIRVRVGETEATAIGYDLQTQELFVNRCRSGQSDFSERFAQCHRASLPSKQGQMDLHIFVDTCSVEVFADGGRLVISDLIFPSPSSTGVQVFAEGGEAIVSRLEVYSLKA